MAIARYLAKRYTGRNDEVLYPGASDPDLTLEIDQIVDNSNDKLMNNYNKFLVPMHPEYKNRD